MEVAEAHILSKSYSNKSVLKEVSFAISPGECVGLIGPNGAGKTTLLNIMTGLVAPTSGKMTLSAERLSWSISRQGFFSDMSVENNILLHVRLLGGDVNALPELLACFQVDFTKKRFGELSAGMKQKVSLLLAFARASDLVMLDEPSNHLDIDALLNLRKLIQQRKEKGTAFLIASHVLSDLEKICDRILFMKEGRIVKEGFSADLCTTYGSLENAYLSLA